MKSKIVAGCGAVAVGGLLLAGCSAKVETSTSVSKQGSIGAEQLQKDVSDRLGKTGLPPKSVTCKDRLAGEVGKTARCDVSFNDTNTIEAVLTATKVDGDTVNFDMAPAMTKEQVEKAVAGLAAVPSATCAGGLDGTVGASTKCDITKDGAASKLVAEVAQVDAAKLGIELSVLTLLPKQKVEEVLMQELSSDGTPVETVECVDDVAAKVGSAIECVSVTGNDRQGYDVTVTEAESLDNVDIDYEAKP